MKFDDVYLGGRKRVKDLNFLLKNAEKKQI